MSQEPPDPGWYPPDPRYAQDPGWNEPTRPLDPYGPSVPEPTLPLPPYPSAPGPYPPAPSPYPYPGYSPYPQGYPPPAPYSRADQPSRKGVVSLCLAISALLISSVLSWIGGAALVALGRLDGLDPDAADLDPALLSQSVRLSYALVGQLVPTGLGISALVVGILACQHRNARGAGIVGIIASVLAPAISFGVFFLAILPIYQA